MPEANQINPRQPTDRHLVAVRTHGAIDLLPKGDYVAVLTDGDDSYTSDTGVDMGYSILCGEFTNHKIQHCLQIRHPDPVIQKDALRQLAALCCACGAPYPSTLADLCNVPFTLSLDSTQTVTGYASLNQQGVL